MSSNVLMEGEMKSYSKQKQIQPDERHGIVWGELKTATEYSDVHSNGM
jgi:hypothetical protein